MTHSSASLLLFGASRGTGFQLARLIRSRGGHVSAMTRTPSLELDRMGVGQWKGNALDADRTVEACRKCRQVDAAICTIGGRGGEPSADGSGAINVIDTARSAGIRRFILVSSLGAGDSRPYASERLLAAIGPVLEEKTRTEQHLMKSEMDFTILRPGQLLDGSPTGLGLLCKSPTVHGCIRRADLAALIMDCLERKETISCILSAISEPQEQRVSQADRNFRAAGIR